MGVTKKKETATKGKGGKSIVKREYTPNELESLDEYDKRLEGNLKPVQFEHTGEIEGRKAIRQVWEDEHLAAATLAKTTGTVHRSFSKLLLEQVIGVSNPTDDPNTQIANMNAALAAMLDIGPRDGLEGMLVAQMIASHNQAMDLMARVSKADYVPKIQIYLNLAVKLQRTFALQIEALKKYRSGGEQKVTVEHVHVNQGGQAIVGNVSRGGGGHDAKKAR